MLRPHPRSSKKEFLGKEPSHQYFFKVHGLIPKCGQDWEPLAASAITETTGEQPPVGLVGEMKGTTKYAIYFKSLEGFFFPP